jgi:hypothetical protein
MLEHTEDTCRPQGEGTAHDEGMTSLAITPAAPIRVRPESPRTWEEERDEGMRSARGLGVAILLSGASLVVLGGLIALVVLVVNA